MRKMSAAMIGMLAAAAASAATAAAPQPVNDTQVAANDTRQFRYVVRDGDSIDRLARRYFVSRAAVDRVLALNQIAAPRWLVIGETLIIPYAALRWTPVNGRIKAFRGLIRIGARAAVVGVAVTNGALVTTAADSFVAIEFPDGSVATLPSNSAVRIVALRRYALTGEVDRRFTIERGASEWRVTPARATGDRFEVRTPVALAAVRGTQFRVTYDADSSHAGSGVVTGEVTFGTDAGATAVVLPVGFGAVADRSGTIDKRALLAAPQLRAPFALQRRPAVTFAAAPVAGAASYLFEVARDAALLDRVIARTVATPAIVLPELADGKYWVRVSATDDVGLQGFGNAYAFARRLNVLAARVNAKNMARLTWRNAGPDTRGYRLVLSYYRDLRDPVVDVDGLKAEGAVVGPLMPGRYYWAVTTLTPQETEVSATETFEVTAR